jgi:nitroimidazol reductase NimA-like FMN-containing flavoprotein (pyridoxamine 5'-phosphate oxidase superfamily)
MSEAPKATPYIITTGEEARSRIETILKELHVGRLGLCDGDKPYVLPHNYLYTPPGELILHGVLNEGKKVELVRKNPNACFEVDRPLQEIKPGMFSCHVEYESVICFGRIHEVDSIEERAHFFEKWNAHYQHDHGDLTIHQIAETCGILIFEIEEATARPGKFLAAEKRPLFVCRFKEGIPRLKIRNQFV